MTPGRSVYPYAAPLGISENFLSCSQLGFMRITASNERAYLPYPLDTGVLHGDVGVEVLGDGAGDEGGALFLE